MSNVGPATVTVSFPTGPGQATSSLKFTDVTKIEVDVSRNVLRLTHSGAGGTSDFAYDAAATVTWTISNGLTTVTFA